MKIRRTSIGTPSTEEGVIHMNARKKEKKEAFSLQRKPTKDSEWVYLSEHMVKWFKANDTIKNLLVYPYRHNFTWSQFKAWRLESEIFNAAVEQCLQICLERREEYLNKDKKLSQVYMREHALYNPMLAEYEKDLKQTEDATNSKAVIHVYRQEIEETPEGKEFKQKKEKGNQ